MLIDIVIPTVDRDELLRRAILGVCEQHLSGAEAKIIVIDNSPDGRQRALVESIKEPSRSGIEICYEHEARPGLAYARNRGVAASGGEFVVFLDDDESPIGDDWLSKLVEAAAQSGADASFGPVVPQFEYAPTRLGEFATALYSRDARRPDRSDITDLAPILGTGNSCFRRQTCFVGDQEPFNHMFDRTGGEDIDLLFRLERQGKRFAWAAGAGVYEFVPVSRLTPAYLSDRRFRQGQQRAYLQIAVKPRGYHALAFWMAVGAAQAAYHLVAALGSRALGRHEAAEQHAVQYWGGVGKVMWQAKYRRDHYGV